MAWFSLFPQTRRRIQSDMLDASCSKLHEAACRLLRDHDHELMSVAQVTKAAGVSVGAFYRRYPDKDAFLNSVIDQHVFSARNFMERVLSRARWDGRSAWTVTRAIVEQMMRDLQGPGAGVVRAALKRGYLKRDRLELLESYRGALADCAVTLLVPRAKHLRRAKRTVRDSVQMATATVLDALLHERGPLRPGSLRMADALSMMMLDALGLAPGRPRKAHDHDEADDDDTAMLEMPATDPFEGAIAGDAPVPPQITRRQTAPEKEPPGPLPPRRPRPRY